LKSILNSCWSMPNISKRFQAARCDVRSHRELLQRATKLSRSLLFHQQYPWAAKREGNNPC
jgi:hypothetical protein